MSNLYFAMIFDYSGNDEYHPNDLSNLILADKFKSINPGIVGIFSIKAAV